MRKNKLIIRPLIFQKVSTIITPNFYQIIVMVIQSNILKFQIHWLSSSQNTHFSYVTYHAVSIVCLEGVSFNISDFTAYFAEEFEIFLRISETIIKKSKKCNNIK